MAMVKGVEGYFYQRLEFLLPFGDPKRELILSGLKCKKASIQGHYIVEFFD